MLGQKDHFKYETYGGYFTFTCMASIQFKLAEFETYRDRLYEYEVQVDTQQRQKDANHDINLGYNLMKD